MNAGPQPKDFNHRWTQMNTDLPNRTNAEREDRIIADGIRELEAGTCAAGGNFDGVVPRHRADKVK